MVIAALAVDCFAEVVMNLLSAVKTENNVVALLVGKLDNVVVNEHAVCGKGKAEILVVLLFNASCICHKLLYNVPIHKRLTAEEVNLKISSCARIFDKKIKRTLSRFKAHNSALARVFTLTCKAVRAVEVTGVGNVQTERLYNA